MNIVLTRLVLAACLAGLLCKASAAGDFTVKGVGLYTCREFLEQASRDPALVDTIYLSWLMGYVSGTNSALAVAKNVDVNVGKDVPPETLRNLLVDACRKLPFKSVFQAGTEVYEELSKPAP